MGAASSKDRPIPANAGRLMGGLYSSLAAFQWVRELLTNAKDADATEIHFGLTKVHGVHKRYALDDGKGMVSHEIADLGLDPGDSPDMAELFGLGYSEDPEEHFGVGAKASLMSWNAHGLLYVSRHRLDSGELVESFAWLAISGGVPVLRAVQTSDGYSSCPVLGVRVEGRWDRDEAAVAWIGTQLEGVEPWRLLDSRLGESSTGTCVLLLGMKPEDATDEGDPRWADTEAANRGIVRYVNGKYLSLDVAVTQDYVATTSGKVKSRSALGFLQELENQFRGPLLTDFVELEDGTRVDWYADATAIRKRAEGERLPQPSGNVLSRSHHVLIVFRDEVYERGGYQARLGSWGVSVPLVAFYTWLVVTPPEAQPGGGYGVHPNQPRSGLVMEGAPELPTETWAQQFRKRFPQELRELMELAKKSLGGDDADDAARSAAQELVQQLVNPDRYKHVLVQDDEGDVPFTPTDDHGGASGEGEASDGENEGSEEGDGTGGGGGSSDVPSGPQEGETHGAVGGSLFARRKRRALGPPRVQPVPEDMMETPTAVVELVYEAEELILKVNREHGYVAREVGYFLTEYDTVDENSVASFVHHGVGLNAVAAYGRAAEDPSVDRHEKRQGSQLLSPESLSLAARVPADWFVRRFLDQRK